MRIIGVGTDIVEIDRVERVLGKYSRFGTRCFTPAELTYAYRFARPARRLAARFAGKEAVMKSLSTGWRRIRWTDIEIGGGGPPRPVLSGTALRRAEQLEVEQVLLSITHTDHCALVTAIAVRSHA